MKIRIYDSIIGLFVCVFLLIAGPAHSATNAELEARIVALETLLSCVTRNAGTLDGLAGPHVIFTGCNVHIRSGSGATSDSVNGTGNLVVGYNEAPGTPDRGGSHNFIVGQKHNYSSYGGFVAGEENTISGQAATVSGGKVNTASGRWSSVSGGGHESLSYYGNEAKRDLASVGGGMKNVADGRAASVSGGFDNESTNEHSSVSGGMFNNATGMGSSVIGGMHNTASAFASSVSGGGGLNTPDGNVASADYSSVSGGRTNTASGSAASVSGGKKNIASGEVSSVTGGEFNTASGFGASVNGGGDGTSANGNVASGDYATIGGGKDITLALESGWDAGEIYK
jgi:hypothetical protein